MNLIDKSELEKLAYMSFQGMVFLRDGKLSEVNAAMEKITGYDRNEFLAGQALHKCIPAKFYRRIFDQAWQVSDSMETNLVKKDGTVLSVEIEKQVINYNNEPLHVIGFRDISIRKGIEEEILKLSVALDQRANEIIITRKKAEKSLIESEEKFRSLVSNIPGVVYRCAFNPDLTVIQVSDAIEVLTGFSAKEFLENRTRSFSGIIHPEDREKVIETIKTGIAGFKQYNVEYRILAKGNMIKWISNNGRPIYGDDQSIKWLDGFLFDITDRIQVLEELRKAKIAAEEANHAKSEFLANISHEIRTPLNAVLGFTELLEGLTHDSTQVKYLNSIKASGKNLMMLINDLLDLSKIEAGKMTLHYSFIDIRQLLNEVRNVFSLRMAIKGIRYVEDLGKDFPAEIKFDETRLRQILINLVGNAVKFTHEGEIRIKIKAHKRLAKSSQPIMHLEIKVIDTGIGIPEDSFRLIFESFRQHSPLNSRKYGGTGLGLSITKRLVEAMNGRISVESKVGRGSTFTLVFPHVEYAENLSEKNHDILQQNIPLKAQSNIPPDWNVKGEIYLNNGKKGGTLINDTEFRDLLKKFEQDLSVKRKLFESKQPLKEIKSFAQDIITLGRSSKLSFILEYGEQLLSTIENFDIEEMRLKLDYFPDLLNQLKRIGHEIR